VDPINAPHLPTPEATMCASSEVALKLLHGIEVVDRELHVVKTKVDGVNHTPGTAGA
jgi:hypothetical protein